MVLSNNPSMQGPERVYIHVEPEERIQHERPYALKFKFTYEE